MHCFLCTFTRATREERVDLRGESGLVVEKCDTRAAEEFGSRNDPVEQEDLASAPKKRSLSLSTWVHKGEE